MTQLRAIVTRFLVLQCGMFLFPHLGYSQCDCASSNERPPSTPVEVVRAKTAAINSNLASETVVVQNAKGEIVSSSSSTFPLGRPDDFERITTENLHAILDVIESEMPDEAFKKLPRARQFDVVSRVEKFVRAFPTSVPGAHLPDEDVEIKLLGLKLALQGLRRTQVYESTDSAIVSRQLAELINEGVSALLSSSKIPADVGPMIRQLIWKPVCEIACDTTTLCFKVPLPDADFQRLLERVRSESAVGSVELPVGLSASEAEQMKKLEDDDLELFLNDRFRGERLATSLLPSLLPIFLHSVANEYLSEARSARRENEEEDVPVVDPSEVAAYESRMQAVMAREQERQRQFLEEHNARLSEKHKRQVEEANAQTHALRPIPDPRFNNQMSRSLRNRLVIAVNVIALIVIGILIAFRSNQTRK